MTLKTAGRPASPQDPVRNWSVGDAIPLGATGALKFNPGENSKTVTGAVVGDTTSRRTRTSI